VHDRPAAGLEVALDLVEIDDLRLRPDRVDDRHRAGGEVLVAVCFQPVERRARGAAAVEVGEVTSTSWSARSRMALDADSSTPVPVSMQMTP
jgi:hypothetical protein